jgi:hypothetical protein
MLNLKKLNMIEGNDEYHVEIWNKFPALEKLDTKAY